jgi:hypothetical protein
MQTTENANYLPVISEFLGGISIPFNIENITKEI